MSSKKFAMLPNDVSVDKIIFSDKVAQNSNNNGRTIYISYPGESAVVMETPLLKQTLPLSVWSNDGNGPDRHSINPAFESELAPLEEVVAFKDFIQNLDECFVNKFLENSGKWVKRQYKDIDVVRELYTKMFKVPKDKEGNPTDKYSPTFKLNLPMRDGNYAFPITDNNGKPFIPTAGNTQGTHVKAIIKLVGMWLAGGKFGCTWRILNMIVVPKDSNQSYAFRCLPAPSQPVEQLDDSNSDQLCTHVESSDDEEVKVPKKSESENEKESEDGGEDDDDDDDDDDDVDAPAPPKLKRVAKK